MRIMKREIGLLAVMPTFYQGHSILGNPHAPSPQVKMSPCALVRDGLM